MPRPKDASEPSKVGPSKAVARLSEDLERLLVEQQLKEKAPKGKDKCPKCGAILEPTRNKRVRTHDDPVKGVRCEASKTLLAASPKPKAKKA